MTQSESKLPKENCIHCMPSLFQAQQPSASIDKEPLKQFGSKDLNNGVIVSSELKSKDDAKKEGKIKNIGNEEGFIIEVNMNNEEYKKYYNDNYKKSFGEFLNGLKDKLLTVEDLSKPVKDQSPPEKMQSQYVKGFIVVEGEKMKSDAELHTYVTKFLANMLPFTSRPFYLDEKSYQDEMSRNQHGLRYPLYFIHIEIPSVSIESSKNHRIETFLIKRGLLLSEDKLLKIELQASPKEKREIPKPSTKGPALR